MPGVAAVIRDAEGRVLLQHHTNGTGWGPPSGAIDPGEAPAEAIVREVREEAGLEVVPVRLVGIVGGPEFRCTYPNGDQVEYTTVVFECRIVGGTLAAPDGEADEHRWFPVDALPTLSPPYPRAMFEAPRGEPPGPGTRSDAGWFHWDGAWRSAGPAASADPGNGPD